MSNAEPAPPQPPARLQIITAALFRMGTTSLALAYQTLGFKTHHGLLEDIADTPWAQLERAAEATWPGVPGAPSPPRAPHTRADWDALFGRHYDAVTDLASPFAPQLIRAYPHAKVVVVQRDFDDWWRSFEAVVLDRVMPAGRGGSGSGSGSGSGEGDDHSPEYAGTLASALCWYVLRSRAVHAMRKIHFGFFGGRNRRECEARAREAYERYFAEVRRLVPPHRRLEYKLADGWGPLCEFLGVDVPDVEFPRANGLEAHHKVFRDRLWRFWRSSMTAMLPWVAGTIVLLSAVTVGSLWL